MIIWLNGCYGVGKTETANLLQKKIENSHIYDPEQMGYFLWASFPASMRRKGDFQDIEIWREFNYKIIRYMYDSFPGHLIIPMTIARVDYFNQTAGRLQKDGLSIHNFLLTARKETIIQRLLQRGEARGCWAELQIGRCLQAFSQDNYGEEVDTEMLDAQAAADFIFNRIFPA